jgi:hypothetical protein
MRLEDRQITRCRTWQDKKRIFMEAHKRGIKINSGRFDYTVRTDLQWVQSFKQYPNVKWGGGLEGNGTNPNSFEDKNLKEISYNEFLKRMGIGDTIGGQTIRFLWP